MENIQSSSGQPVPLFQCPFLQSQLEPLIFQFISLISCPPRAYMVSFVLGYIKTWVVFQLWHNSCTEVKHFKRKYRKHSLSCRFLQVVSLAVQLIKKMEKLSNPVFCVAIPASHISFPSLTTLLLKEQKKIGRKVRNKNKSKYLKHLGVPFEKLKYNFRTFLVSSIFFNSNIA